MNKFLAINVLMACLLASCSHDPLLERAEQGDASAQMQLAIASAQSKDAVAWYQKAAKQGHAEAQNNLAVLYQHGDGVQQNYVQALRWFKKSAEQDNATAQFNVGNLYHRGLGVPQDFSQAIIWYTKAAEQDFTEAQLQLAFIYHQGQGVAVDFEKAYAWAALAAASGNKLAIKQRNNSAAMLNTEDLVEAQKQAAELAEKITGKLL